MKDFLKRLTSRKFIAASAVEVAALVALFNPGIEGTVESTIVRVGAIAAMVLVALGYIVVEGNLDKWNSNR